MNRITRFSAYLLIAATLVSCSRSHYITITGYAQGGTYSVKADISAARDGQGHRIGEAAIRDSIESILTLIDTTLSGYNRNSILSRRNAGEEVETNSCWDEVLTLSEKYAVLTEGAFDVKAAPLFDIWGFGFKSGEMPSDSLIQVAMEECRKGRVLNFNAIAQGYTADVIAGFLKRKGVSNYLVDIGEIRCEGVNRSGEGWTVGIDTPEDGNQTPGASFSGIWHSDGASHGIVTSGNYRKFYIRDGKKYAHTIDPRSGRPVEHNLLSATVIAPTAADADALATYFMVIGMEEARKYTESHEGIEAFLISSEGSWSSEGF